jgi:hypothetical protein
LRGLGFTAMPLSLANPSPSNPAQIAQAAAAVGQVPDASTICSTWDFYFDPASWIACTQAVIAAAPQSVVANATAAGYPQSVIDVAQAAADQQSSSAASDAANIANFYGAGKLLYDPLTTTLFPWWVWAGLAIGGFLLIRTLR